MGVPIRPLADKPVESFAKTGSGAGRRLRTLRPAMRLALSIDRYLTTATGIFTVRVNLSIDRRASGLYRTGQSEGEDGKRIGLLPGEIVLRRQATVREGQPVFKETPSQDLGRFGGRDRNSRGRPVSRVSSLRSNRGRSGGSASLRCHDQRSDRRTYSTSASIPGSVCGS